MLDEFAKLAKGKATAAGVAGAAGAADVNQGGQVSAKGQVKGKTGTDEEEGRKKKFVQAVREAERSTLIFNTDMGKVPVMNHNTMNRNFSLALKVKAAETDGNVNGEPKADTITQLDDTLSMVKSMDYFGKTTKQAKDKGFFTIPVKLAFKDKDTRIAAEQNLKKLCKVSCTTPYHSALRDFMKKTVEECKVKYQGCYVQAKVDVEGMALKISYMDRGNWTNDVEMVPLPDSVYDTSNKVSRVKVNRAGDNTLGEPMQG